MKTGTFGAGYFDPDAGDFLALYLDKASEPRSVFDRWNSFVTDSLSLGCFSSCGKGCGEETLSVAGSLLRGNGTGFFLFLGSVEKPLVDPLF